MGKVLNVIYPFDQLRDGKALENDIKETMKTDSDYYYQYQKMLDNLRESRRSMMSSLMAMYVSILVLIISIYMFFNGV